jgi:hypothetical protein
MNNNDQIVILESWLQDYVKLIIFGIIKKLLSLFNSIYNDLVLSQNILIFTLKSIFFYDYANKSQSSFYNYYLHK